MDDLLTRLIARADDRTAKAWVAKALLVVFPEPLAESELTHVRAELAPIHGELRALAKSTEGTRLPMHGRRDEEPYLALAVMIAETRLLPKVSGFLARRMMAGALFELLIGQPALSQQSETKTMAVAIRLELAALFENPTAMAPMPEFRTVFDLARWLDIEANTNARFRDYFREAWRRTLSRQLRHVLLFPRPAPGMDGSDEEEGTAGSVLPIVPKPGLDPTTMPLYGWLPAMPQGHAERRRTPGTSEVIARASLSTLTPLSAFSTASSLALTDKEMRHEMARLMRLADDALAQADLIGASRALARALVAATATLGTQVAQLQWGSPAPGSTLIYPGAVSTDANWLFRPELRPESQPDSRLQVIEPDGSGTVLLPLPPSLAKRLLALHSMPVAGQPVFPVLSGLGSPHHSSDRGSASMTALRRALASRLMRQEPLGITGAQWAAADDFGLGRAPLFYDHFSADRFTSIVERITFPWFDDAAGRARRTRPSHQIGSRRIPELDTVQQFHASLREPLPAQLQAETWALLHQRTRNLVHGLAACSGHRPTNGYEKLRLSDFGVDDPIATLADKEAGIDWQVRPVVVPKPWRKELCGLLEDLLVAQRDYADRPLGHAASAALKGTGPLFLAVTSPDQVTPFGLPAYREGLPGTLLEVGNFARHLLNRRLTGTVPEVLRTAQMGWHGMRGGAWEEGSPWSALAVAKALEQPLCKVLEDVNWRPLSRKSTVVPTLPLESLTWLARERSHMKVFRRALLNAQAAMAKRHGLKARTFLPRFSAFLAQQHPQLVLMEGRGIVLAENAPANCPITLSLDDHDRMLRALCGGNFQGEDAKIARNLLSALIRSARKRNVVAGPIPRRIVWYWPSRPGPFMRGIASAPRVASRPGCADLRRRRIGSRSRPRCGGAPASWWICGRSDGLDGDAPNRSSEQAAHRARRAADGSGGKRSFTR